MLESAIRNDYDSILITELNLEKPDPKLYMKRRFEMTGFSKGEAIGNTQNATEPKQWAILDRLKRRLIEGQAFLVTLSIIEKMVLSLSINGISIL